MRRNSPAGFTVQTPDTPQQTLSFLTSFTPDLPCLCLTPPRRVLVTPFQTLAAANKTSGTGTRKARSGDGGGSASAAAPRPVSSVVTSFLESKTDSPASKKQKQEIDLINAKIKLKEAETKQQQEAATSQQHQAFFREMMEKMSEVVREMKQK